jgi:6-phosphofructo-2-kinase
MRLKLSGPDYKDQNPTIALEDFKNRVQMYEKKYVPLGEDEERQSFSFCQMIDVGRKFVTHNIQGFLATQLVSYLQHFNLAPRQVWLTRHGESLDNAVGKIGGDSHLSQGGYRFSSALARFIEHERRVWTRRQEEYSPTTSHDADQLHYSRYPGLEARKKKFHIWTSTTRRSVQTAQFFDRSNYQVQHMCMLDELNAGILDGLSDEEVKRFYADESQTLKSDKVPIKQFDSASKRYLDVTARLKSVILELERVPDHVLIIGGLAVLRVLLAYCRGLQRDENEDFHVPLGKLYMLEPVSPAKLPFFTAR